MKRETYAVYTATRVSFLHGITLPQVYWPRSVQHNEGLSVTWRSALFSGRCGSVIVHAYLHVRVIPERYSIQATMLSVI